MTYEDEFSTAELIIDSDHETRGVDAFSLSFIKSETQIRKIFTHVIFQSDSFDETTIDKLIQILADNRKVYFSGFIRGFYGIYPVSIETIYGDSYKSDLEKIETIQKYRNKIFHGQLTGDSLSQND